MRRNPTQIYVSCVYPLKIFLSEPKAVQKFSYICAVEDLLNHLSGR